MVTLFMVVVLGVVMVSSAFVVDLGMQRVARADMQALADVVALDLARELDGRTVSQLESLVDDLAQQSIARNQGTVGKAPDLDITLGTLDGDGDFDALSSGVPTAVSVVAATDVAFAFAGFTGTDEGGAARDAAAASSSTACFRLGSFVAAIDAGDGTVLGPLNDLLGVNLDLVSYRALAHADVRLGDLVADPRIGSAEALLTGTIAYRTLLQVMADVLDREPGSENQVAVSALNKLASATLGASLGAVSLGNVLNVSPTDRAAMEVALDVLDVVGSARLSDGEYFLSVPNLQAGVPGIGNKFEGGIHLVSAAELACGKPNTEDAQADNAQLSGAIDIEFINMPSMNLPGVGTLQTAKGTGSIVVEVGEGIGKLVSPPEVRCGAGTKADPSTFTVDVSTNLASYRLDADVSVMGEVKLSVLEDLGLGGLLDSVLGGLLGGLLGGNKKLDIEVEVSLSIGTMKSAQGQLANLSIPPNDIEPVRLGSSMVLDPSTVVPTVRSVRIGGATVPLAGVTALTNKIVDGLVVDDKGLLGKTLTPLIDNINEKFIGPVARMIGLRLGGADVFAVGARCGDPRLVG